MGSDASFAYWDKDARTKLKSSETLDQPITKCCFNSNGQIFAYSTGYDWSKVCILVMIKVIILLLIIIDYYDTFISFLIIIFI